MSAPSKQASKEKTTKPQVVSLSAKQNFKTWYFRVGCKLNYNKNDYYREIGIDIDDGPQLNEAGIWCIDVTYHGPIHRGNIYHEPVEHILNVNDFYLIHQYILENLGQWRLKFRTWFISKCNKENIIKYQQNDIIHEKGYYYLITNIAKKDHLLYFKKSNNIYRDNLLLYEANKIKYPFDSCANLETSTETIWYFTNQCETALVCSLNANIAATFLSIEQYQRTLEYKETVRIAFKKTKTDLNTRNVGRKKYLFKSKLDKYSVKNYILYNAKSLASNTDNIDIMNTGNKIEINFDYQHSVNIFGDDYFKKQCEGGDIFVYKGKFIWNTSGFTKITGYIIQQKGVEEWDGMDILSSDESDDENDEKKKKKKKKIKYRKGIRSSQRIKKKLNI